MTDSMLLDQFWKLMSENEAQQMEACFKILSHLEYKENNDNAEMNGEDGENNTNSAIIYCLKRCIQGLASSKESSRHGCYMLLTELLPLYSKKRDGSLDLIEELLQKMDEYLNPSHASKGEEGEYLIGKCFCIRAIIYAGLLNGKKKEISIILERLVKLGSQRSYLKNIAYLTIVMCIKSGISFKAFETHCWPKVNEACKWNDKENDSVASLWLFLEIANQYPTILDNKAIMVEVAGRKKLVTEEFAKEAASVIMGNNVIPKVIRELSLLPKLVKMLSLQPGMIDYFWNKQIDLIPSTKRKNIIKFSMLDAIVENESEAIHIPKLFTKNVVTSMIQILSKVETSTEEESIVLAVLERIISKAKDEKQILKPILKLLLQEHGKITFDKITGHGTIQKLTTVADIKTVKMIAKLYLEALIGNDKSSSDEPKNVKIFTAQERVYAAQQLAKLVGHSVMQEEVKWKIEILTAILSLTLFEMKQCHGPLKEIPQALSHSAKAETKEIFFRALDVKAKNFETMCSILTSTLEYTNDLMKNAKLASPLYPMDEGTINVWNKVFKTVMKLKMDSKKESKVFQLLFTHMGFQLFLDPVGAGEIIDDLYICAEESEKSAKSKNEDEPKWVEVVVDSLISLMSQNKHVLRQVVNTVMALLCPHITVSALQAVIEVIDPQQDEEDKEQSDENPEDSDYEDLNDKENEADETSDDDADETSDDDDDSSEDENEKPKIDEDFKEKVKDALGDAKAESDDDNASIDMDDLDDEAMEKMDTALGQLFKQISGKKSQAQKKKEKKDAMAQMHFKIRCLDIIDVYISHQPKMSHVVFLILPLLKAIETYMNSKDQQPLSSRLKNTLKKITSSKKVEDADEELEPSSLVDMLRSLIDLSNSSSALVNELSQPIPLYAECCTLILKFTQKLNDKKVDDEILELYKSSLMTFFNKTHCQLPITVFLLPMKINWFGSWSLIDSLIENGFSSGTRFFLRGQAFTLLNAMLRNESLQKLADKDKKEKSLNALSTGLVAEFNKYIAGNSDLKPRFLCELLNITHGLHLAGGSTVISQWDAVVKVLENLRNHIPKNRHFRDVKKAYNKAAAPLKLKVVQGCEKRIRENDNGTTDSVSINSSTNGFFDGLVENGSEQNNQEKKKTKKKKKSNTDLQKKKERKLQALEGQFEGMTMPDFSGVILSDNMNFETK